jgi:tagaturonate epimerase
LDELCGPYASVVKIDRTALPSPDTVKAWDSETFAATLRHDQTCKAYNSNVRQLLHVGYKLAAEMGGRYISSLEKHADVIAANVKENIYQRHICPLFLGK